MTADGSQRSSRQFSPLSPQSVPCSALLCLAPLPASLPLLPLTMSARGSLLCVLLALAAARTIAEGELVVLHAPSSIKLSGHADLLESLLREVYTASLGLSVEESSDWSGLSITDPFNTPEAVVEVYIDGVAGLGNAANLKAHRFPLVLDEFEPETFSSLDHRVRQRYAGGANRLVDIALNDQTDLNRYSEIFGKIKVSKAVKMTLSYLKPDSVEEDQQFVQELETLDAITKEVGNGAVTPDNVVDFYHFKFQSLHPLSDLHGADSLETKEAKKLLGDALARLNSAFVKAYDGSVLVTAVSSDAHHTRRTARSADQETGAAALRSVEDWNKAESYGEDYPVIFNIMLWFGIVFSFALLAIVYAIMDMDPGRDSIIYRMTSTRMKKDN